MNQAYHTPCQWQVMYNTFTNRVNIDYSKLKGANILIALFNEVYVLAKVDYPNRTVKVYLSDKDTIVEVDVVELFKLTQSESCLVWCEL